MYDVSNHPRATYPVGAKSVFILLLVLVLRSRDISGLWMTLISDVIVGVFAYHGIGDQVLTSSGFFYIAKHFHKLSLPIKNYITS